MTTASPTWDQQTFTMVAKDPFNLPPDGVFKEAGTFQLTRKDHGKSGTAYLVSFQNGQMPAAFEGCLLLQLGAKFPARPEHLPKLGAYSKSTASDYVAAIKHMLSEAKGNTQRLVGTIEVDKRKVYLTLYQIANSLEDGGPILYLWADDPDDPRNSDGGVILR
jgi:hypothetical protein